MNLAGLVAGALVLSLAWGGRPPPRRVRQWRARQAPPRRPRTWGSTVWVAATLALLAVAPPLAAVVAGALLARPWWRRRRAAAAHRAAVAVALPDAVDLIVVALWAGFTPRLAIDEVAGLAPPPVGDALAEVARRVGRGVPLAEALDVLPDLLGEAARPLTAALVSGERDGVPLGPTLDVLARDAREQRRHTAEAAARRLPVRLAFPLACCILPAFVLLTVAPLVAGAVASLQP